MSTSAIPMSPSQTGSAPVAAPPGNVYLVPGSSNTRPLWFDGRFLTAADLAREQNYFLNRQASLGQAGGFGVLHGLFVEQGLVDGQPAPDTIMIRAGDGITPSGELVMIPADLPIQLSDIADEENLDEQFGLAEAPQQPARTRTGIHIVALRPVEFTANPITSYPANLQAARITRDGDIVEATAVSLLPYPNPVNTFDASLQQAALARQIFVGGGTAVSSDSLLPLAMIGIDRDVIQWIDPYLVRRDSGPQYNATRFGLAEAAVQQAFFLQYDARLQAVMAPFLQASAAASFPATDYFQALPPAARFPLGAINPASSTQIFFPQQISVTLSAVPEDELAALLADAMSLPPLDLTLPASAYANMSLSALVALPRAQFASLESALPDAPLSPALPPPGPRPLNSFLQPPRPIAIALPGQWLTLLQPPSPASPPTYGFYVLRRSEPVFPSFTLPATTTTPSPHTSTPVRTFLTGQAATPRPLEKATPGPTTTPRLGGKTAPAPTTTPRPRAKVLPGPTTTPPPIKRKK